MPTHRCEIYMELAADVAAPDGLAGEAGPETVVMVQRVELPFAPMRGVELNFGVPTDHGGTSDTALQLTIHAVRYHIKTGWFTVFCRPTHEFAAVQIEIGDEQRREQIIEDCTLCGFWPVPTFE